MKNFRILFLVLLLQSFNSNAEELSFRLTAEHDAGLAELIAQGTTLFFSALTGIDFMDWEATTTQTWTRGSNFDIIGRIPSSEIKRVQESVKRYVESGSLSEDFGKQGLETGISFWVPNPSPTSSDFSIPSQSSLPSSTPTTSMSSSFMPKHSISPTSISALSISPSPTFAKPFPSSDVNDFESNLEIEITFTPEPEDEISAIPIADNPVNNEKSTDPNDINETPPENGYNEEGIEVVEESGIAEIPSSKPQGTESSESENPTYTPIPEVNTTNSSYDDLSEEIGVTYPPPFSDIAERTFELGSTKKLSNLLNLTVSSPVFGFPSDLRDAFKWLISEETRTNVDDWILWDLLENNDGTFSAFFRKIGEEKENNKTITYATEFVRSGQLENKLLEIDSAGEFQVGLLQNDYIHEEGNGDVGNFIEPSILPFPPEATPSIIPELKRGEEIFEFPLNISSPIHGFGNELEQELRMYTAAHVNLTEMDFILQSVEPDPETSYFEVLYGVRVDESIKFNVSEALIELVRNKSVDEHLSAVGYDSVEVRLVPRIMNTTNEDSEKSRQRGALKPSAGTIAASIVGIAVVMVIGIVVALYCLPKSKNTQLQG